MKRVAHILIFLYYVTWTVTPLIKLCDYVIRIDVYMEMCENKSNPDMCCHGKCQIFKSDSNEPQQPESNILCNDFSFGFLHHIDKSKTLHPNAHIDYCAMCVNHFISNIMNVDIPPPKV